VAWACDALNRSEWRHANFDRVALGSSAKLFEQIAHCRCKLRLISRAHGCDGLKTLGNFDFSAHRFILA
jgi:hypothetical protein